MSSQIKSFSDDQKLSVSSRLVSEIFGGVAEGSLIIVGDDVDPKVLCLFTDAVHIMCAPEIRFSIQVGQRDVNDEADDDEPPEAYRAAAHRLISHVYRNSLVEATMPYLVALREFLFERHSPHLYECMAVIL